MKRALITLSLRVPYNQNEKLNRMKREYLKRLFACVAGVGIALSVSAQFIHPGGLHTQADFDRVKSKVEANEEPWSSAYKKLKSSSHVDLNWTPRPVEKIIRGGKTIWEPEPDNYWNAYQDAATAYQCALVWKISGDKAYADKSIQILNAWARRCRAVGGDTNGSLASGLYGYQFANAAEIMRGYEGWKENEFEQFKDMMLRVFYKWSIGFLEGRHGTIDEHYWSNWGLCNTLCIISIGLLCDDVFLYNSGMEYYKHMENRRYGESLHHLVWQLYKDDRGPFGYLGQMQESNRDQGHALMAAGLAADLCGVGLNQGDDLFAHMNDRIAAGFEYVAYNSGVNDLPNSPYVNASHGTQNSMGPGARGTIRPIWGRIVNYYENVRGVEMSYSKKMKNKEANGIDGGGGFYTTTSNGYDHLGFTALMCSLDPLTDLDKVPVVLTPSIEYAGKVSQRSGMNCIAKGSTVKLSVALPADVTDTGNWTWDDEPACVTSEREIILNSSEVLRVRYTNDKGAVSTQMFSLHVEGEGWVGAYTPYYKLNMVTGKDTVIYMKKYDDITIGIDYSASSVTVREWIWERSTSGTTWSKMDNNSRLLNLTSVSSNSYYRVTMINKAGAKVSQVFKIEVAEIDPFIIANGGETYSGIGLTLPRGSSVGLYAIPNTVLSKSPNSTRIYKWVVDGDTIQENRLTYHLDDLGNNVADLSDTLHVAVLDSCFTCTLYFQYVTSKGVTSETVYHFDIPVYEIDDLKTDTDDSFYIIDPLTGKLLNNTDATFITYNEDNDITFLWRLRQLNATYGNRYMFVSRANPNAHLTEWGKMSTSNDYSKHSFSLLHKYSDENLYAIQRSPATDGGLFDINSQSALTVSRDICRGFPFKIVNVKEGDNEEPDGIEKPEELHENSIVTYVKNGRELILQAQEQGTLHIYNTYGQLLQTNLCTQGVNYVALEKEYFGVAVCRYVSKYGQQKTFKLFLTQNDF